MSQPLLKVVPLPEKRVFESNNSSISGLSQSGTYMPNGNYTLSCSSSSNPNRDAYHAFNNNKNYWESNYKGNPSYNTLNSSYPDYTQSIRIIKLHFALFHNVLCFNSRLLFL